MAIRTISIESLLYLDFKIIIDQSMLLKIRLKCPVKYFNRIEKLSDIESRSLFVDHESD